MMRIFLITPLLIFVLIISILLVKMISIEKTPPSPMIGQSFPPIILPTLFANTPFNSEQIKGQYSLVNIFASWCAACKLEHKNLMHIKKNSILPIYGINWKDSRDKVGKWLQDSGNPYTKIAVDISGEAIAKLGVSGTPESFLISPEGIIVYHMKGVLTKDILDKRIIPHLETSH